MGPRIPSETLQFGDVGRIKYSLTVPGTVVGCHKLIGPSLYKKNPVLLGTGVLPALVAPTTLRAREDLVAAYKLYYEEGGHLDPEASGYIKSRHAYFSRCEIPLEDIARMEVASSVGLLSNVIPATFWVIYHLYSNPDLLQAVRDSLLSQGTTVDEGGKICSVDLDHVKTRCPVLLATFQEVFRYHSIGVSSRWIREDHLLNGQYLLKKGNILVVPASVQHNLESAWGDNVDEFDHQRFLSDSASKTRQRNPVAFRGFGGDSTLCPGRHFAATEIMGFTALFVIQFDARPYYGEWKSPTWKNTNHGTSIHQPDDEFDVEITPRDDRHWKVNFFGSQTALKVSAEDIIAAAEAEDR